MLSAATLQYVGLNQNVLHIRQKTLLVSWKQLKTFASLHVYRLEMGVTVVMVSHFDERLQVV